MRDVLRGSVVIALLALAGASPARALDVQQFHGHLSLGYSRVFIDRHERQDSDFHSDSDSPGGSLSVAGGVDYPMIGPLRLGADVGFALLGSRTVALGREVANLDYTLFEAALLAHWKPNRLGPVARISFGPALESARAELSTSGGGIPFSRLAIEKVAPGAALDVTLMKKSSRSPVLAGLELGVHAAFLPSETWTIANARLAIHY